jgi:primosomal protein N' (replication factor Y) (superfamily II helicase)
VPVARVIVDISTRAIDRAFDYSVPPDLQGSVAVGCPVLVPFGSQQVVGYVVGLPEAAGVDHVKPLTAVLDEPWFASDAPPLASWIASEYVAPLSDALRLFLPPGGTPRVKRSIVATGPRPERPSLRQEVYDAVAAGPTTQAGLRGLFGPGADSAVAGLVRDGALARSYALERPGAAAVDDRVAELVEGSKFEPRKGAVMQRALVAALSEGPVAVPELAAGLGSVHGALRRLEEAGAVRVVSRRRVRVPGGPVKPAPRHEMLSEDQSRALAAVLSAVESGGGVVLVDGVTGSGKTEVYLRALESIVDRGRAAIVLVPEISLTPQTVGRFRARFGDLVAVLHSRLSAGERFDQWDLARSGVARVVVGARSALFAPVPDLGLVVIDEEHENTYKQGQAPRYDARMVAERLCAARGIPLVLGSATPRLESIIAAEEGRYRRVVMTARVAGGTLPDIRVVDMASEFSAGHRSMFSRPLAEALGDVQEQQDKAVLFINRRGFASFLLCRECGYVPGCPDCDVSLTYHEVGARLVCHHCGHTEAVPPRCPSCGSPYLRQFGTGTQRVEAELAALIPEMPIVRMDADTTTGKGGHERRLAEFEALDSGVLLGTQMIAKGLDYPEVTLVGVVNADTTLHLPDFRAGERTWQLLQQVAGRAGRGERPGTVIVQTYWPDHPAIRAVAAHDPDTLFGRERAERAELGYPPFGRLANIVFTGADAGAVRTQAAAFASALAPAVEDREGWRVLGPSPAPLARVRKLFRWHVLLKAPVGADIPSVVASALRDLKPDEGVSVAPDVDPMDLL